MLWAGPPTAEEIRRADQQRMQNDPIFAEVNTEEDTELAKMLMAERTPEDIAGALVRMYRGRLPSPEDVFEAGTQTGKPPRDRSQRPERPDKREREQRKTFGPTPEGEDATTDKSFQRRSTEPMVWFRMNVGRTNNADPKWIVPVICRLGHITKNEIGIIKIFDKETKFEILEEAAGKFASSVRKNSGEENVNIQPAAGTLQELRKFTPKPYGSNKDSAGYKGGADGKPRNFDKPGDQGERKGLFKKDFSGPKKEFAGPKKDFSGPKKEFSGPKKDFSGERPAYAGKPAGERTEGPKKFGKKLRPKAD